MKQAVVMRFAFNSVNHSLLDAHDTPQSFKHLVENAFPLDDGYKDTLGL